MNHVSRHFHVAFAGVLFIPFVLCGITQSRTEANEQPEQRQTDGSGSKKPPSNRDISDREHSVRELSLPPGPIPDFVPINPEAQEIIRRMTHGDPNVKANDPLLGDVMRATGRTKPIWAGTALDPGITASAGNPSRASSRPGDQRDLSKRRRAAQQLIKTIRMLEKVDTSASSTELIDMMQAEAVRLLSVDRGTSEAGPPTSTPPPVPSIREDVDGNSPPSALDADQPD